MSLLQDPKHAEWEYAWRIMTGRNWTPLWMTQVLVRLAYGRTYLAQPHMGGFILTTTL